MKSVVLGIDIGGTNTKFGLVEQNGGIVSRHRIPTHADQPASDFFDRLFGEIQDLKGDVSDEVEVKGIGVGAPNANHHTGMIETPPNLSWGTVDIVELIQRHMDLPVAITNDANASALGEFRFGAAKGMKHFIQITLGTGVGSGIIEDGKLIYGHDGFAGEMGHVTAVRGGRQCNCGKKGCLETYASVNGLRRTIYELLSEMTEKSGLRDLKWEEMTGDKIHEAAKNGDPVAERAFGRTARILGEAMADAAAYFSPEAFVLFGGMMGAAELILDPVKDHMEENLFPVFKGKIQVIPSALDAGSAGIIGAAALIWGELEKKEKASEGKKEA